MSARSRKEQGAPLLQARQVKVHLKVSDRIVHAVDGVDIDVHPGECVGIVGESGSGKSTLGRAITRLLPNIELAHFSGQALFDGQDVMHLPEGELRALRRRGSFSMVFQDPLGYLNPTRRVAAQIGEALDAVLDRPQSRADAAALLKEVGLDDPARVFALYPHELSGGMRQRVLIAMALASNPRLLVADEPTTALDATVQYQVIETLRRLNKEKNLAMLIITHDLGMIAELCERVYVMHGGKVVEEAEVRQLFAAPKHDYTATLIGAAKRLYQSAPRDRVAPPARPAPILAAQAVLKSYPGKGWNGWRRNRMHAVDDVSVEVREGETLAIVGESGSGKSSLARMLLGLSAPEQGQILFRGGDLAQLSRDGRHAFRKNVQAVFQDPAASLNPRMRVMTTLANVLLKHRLATPATVRDVAAAKLEAVGLTPAEHFLDRFPHQLSGGQQQRIAIARAMAIEPKLLIADEPLSSLDVSVQAQVLDLLVALKARQGVGLVLISHDLNVVAAVADRVAVMLKGKVVESGPARDVLGNPQHAYTRQLLNARLTADPDAARGRRPAVAVDSQPT